MAEYFVNDIYQCLQGEGSMTGTPMILLRLQGCAVGCTFCDTKQTWTLDPAHQVATIEEALGENPKWCKADETTIARVIYMRFSAFETKSKAAPGTKWILISGGEPAAQSLSTLVATLHKLGYKVALETSGTDSGFVGATLDWICVSPKFDNPGGKAITRWVFRYANEFKFVVGRESDLAKIDSFLAENSDAIQEGTVLCLQPISQNERATQLCVEQCMQRGWRLSLQTHKWLKLP